MASGGCGGTSIGSGGSGVSPGEITGSCSSAGFCIMAGSSEEGFDVTALRAFLIVELLVYYYS